MRRAMKGASPPVPLLWLLRRHPCLLRSEPRPGEGASVARWRPPPRVAVSSSTSAAPAAEGGWGAECPTLPPPPSARPPSSSSGSRFFWGRWGLCGRRVSGFGGRVSPGRGGGPTMPCGAGARHARFPSSRRLDGERWGSVRARESRPRRKKKKAAQRSRLLARGGRGKGRPPGAGRCATLAACGGRVRERRRRPPPRRAAWFLAVPAAADTPPSRPCKPLRRGSEPARRQSPEGRGRVRRAGAVREAARARRGWRLPG